MAWKTLDDMDLAGKVVLTRVDINVPMNEGQVSDTTRIERVAPTIRDILAKGGKPVLLAHYGRPKGKVVADMSLQPLVETLERMFEVPVRFASDCIGPAAMEAVSALPEGEVLVLENTRFHAGEEANDPEFAASLAALGDLYCNDAFSAAHRAHGSTEGIARFLPSCAGRLMAAELGALDAALGQPERPVVAIVGGAKVSTKLDLLGNLLRKVDFLVIGGGMANTFLAAQGVPVGRSLAEREMTETAAEILGRAEEAACDIVLPTDIVVAHALKAGAPSQTLSADACPPDMMILDAGPETVARIAEILAEARTLIWNGPLGAFEIEPFDTATLATARAAAERTRSGKLVSVAGGGDTVAALNRAGVLDDFTYISTAGGAFLEWMEGKTLPGVAALSG